MNRIRFIEAKFLDPGEARSALEARLRMHLHRLREARTNAAGDGALDRHDLDCIRRRVKRLLERRDAASGPGHLRREDRERLEGLKNGALLATIPSEHRADELAAELHAGMPWLAPATEIVWHAMRRSVRERLKGVQLPPMLLDGPPGIGKSSWARNLGQLLALPTAVIEATGENASFGIVGSQRGWSGGCPGRFIETVLQTGIASPLIVVDEVEKAGIAVSKSGQTYGLAEALLPLLEPISATRWSCPYFQVKFDISWVIWVLTSNDCRRLPAPLLSRCPPIRLRELTLTDLHGFVEREGRKRGLQKDAIEAVSEALMRSNHAGLRPDLRLVSRLMRRASEWEHAPRLH